MALQFSEAVRNGRLDAVETVIGASAVMKIFDGAKPANCAAADVGTMLAQLDLPADYMAVAASGAKAKANTWQDAAANAAGNAQYFRIYANGGTVCHMQGEVTNTAGAGPLKLDNTNIAIGQVVTITSFTITDGNA